MYITTTATATTITICTSLQTDNHTNTSSLNFYRLDALPDAQPTVSELWRRHKQIEICFYLFVIYTSVRSVKVCCHIVGAWRAGTCWEGGGARATEGRAWAVWANGARSQAQAGEAGSQRDQWELIAATEADIAGDDVHSCCCTVRVHLLASVHLSPGLYLSHTLRLVSCDVTQPTTNHYYYHDYYYYYTHLMASFHGQPP